MSKKIFIPVIWLLSFCCSSLTLAADDNLQDYEPRMEFIESSLEENHQHARYWQNGWSTFYAVSAVAQTALWIDADNNDDSINYGINALKSVGGLADMLVRPHPGHYGTKRLVTLPETTEEHRRERLDFGETVLRESAERAASRRTWKPHLKVIGVNVIAGALIAAFGDGGDALASSALGIAIGEANIWTQPTGYEEGWNNYQVTFSDRVGENTIRWQLVPMLNAIPLQGRF